MEEVEMLEEGRAERLGNGSDVIRELRSISTGSMERRRRRIPITESRVRNLVTEEVGERRSPTPVLVSDFNTGEQKIVKAKLRCCQVSRQCLTFWTHTTVLSVVLVMSLIMLILTESGTIEFNAWMGLVTFSLGAFFPSPKYKKASV